MKPEDEKMEVNQTADAVENDGTAATSSVEEQVADATTQEGVKEEQSDVAVENEEDYFVEREPDKRRKHIRRKDMTPEQRRRRRITDLIITGTVFGVVLLFFAICALCSFVGYTGNFDYIATIQAVDYDSPYELGYDEELGYYTFTATDDSDFRVLRAT